MTTHRMLCLLTAVLFTAPAVFAQNTNKFITPADVAHLKAQQENLKQHRAAEKYATVQDSYRPALLDRF